MREPSPLPPGQVEVDDFPRFGLANFAFRLPTETERIEIAVDGDVERPTRFGEQLESHECVEQVSDLHCVTTWTRRALRWRGWRFRDFYEQLVVPCVRPEAGATLVVLRAKDGLAQSLPLEDMLAPDVLLADRLDGARLGVAHGAPVGLVALAHYACKSVRHLNAVEFWRHARHYRFPGPTGEPRSRARARDRGEERSHPRGTDSYVHDAWGNVLEQVSEWHSGGDGTADASRPRSTSTERVRTSSTSVWLLWVTSGRRG